MNSLTKKERKNLKSKLRKDFVREAYPPNNSFVDVKTKYGKECSCRYTSGKYQCLNQPYSFGKHEIIEWSLSKDKREK